MIALRADCLLVAQAEGGFVPCSAEQLTLEIVGDGGGLIDPEVLQHAATAVIHYFREELERNTVTLAEFAAMLGRVLQGLGIMADVNAEGGRSELVRVADLRTLATDSGPTGELEFFQRLRTLLREQLAAAPGRLEIRGLRGCVKRLSGRKHWCPKCERLEAWILELIRGWFEQEIASGSTALVVR